LKKLFLKKLLPKSSHNMAIGKGQKKRKGGKKKAVDCMTRKEWVQIHLAAFIDGNLRPFSKHKGSWTIVNRSQGTVLATDSLMDRQLEIRAEDRDRDMTQESTGTTQQEGIANNFVVTFKVVAVKDDEKAVVAIPHSVRPTKSFIFSNMRKRVTTIDAHVDFKTADGYTIRVLMKALTMKNPGAVKLSAYAKSSQVRMIREKMKETCKTVCTEKSLAAIVDDMVSSKDLNSALDAATKSIYPLNPDAYMYWLRIVKEPPVKFTFGMMKSGVPDEEYEMADVVEDEGEDIEEVEM